MTRSILHVQTRIQQVQNHLSQNCFSHKIQVFVGFFVPWSKKKITTIPNYNGKFVTLNGQICNFKWSKWINKWQKKSHFASISSLQIGHVASTRWSWSNGTATSLLGVIGPEFGRGVPKKGLFARPRYEFRIFVRHFSKMFWKGVSQLNC